MLKKIFKIIALLSILLVVVYNLLLSDFNPIFNNEEFVYLTNSIKSTQKEDLEAIIVIYNELDRKIKRKSWQSCPCEIATTYISPYRHGFSLTKNLYLKKIEREFSHDDCLKFELMNTDFMNGNIGIKSAAKFYFGKSVEELNEKEKITFIVMLKNPVLYNPLRRKEKVEEKVRLYQRILNGKNGW